jgi:hypothetical protein
MLATGAHVKIGTKEFRLAFGGQEAPYAYSLNPTGEEVSFWLWDDWVGGEGNDAFDPNDPTVYDKGLTNPRVPGTLTSPPARSSAATATLSPVPNTALHAIAGGRLYVITEAVSSTATSYWYYTTDLATPDEKADSGWHSAIDKITAVTSDGADIYLAGFDNATEDFEIRQIRGVDASTSNIRNYTGTGNTSPIVGMGVLGNQLYYFNGNKLFYRKISDGTGATQQVARTLFSGAGSLTINSNWWAGMVSGDGALYFFNATEGKSTVYEARRNGAVNEMWNMPSGFTAKDIVYQSGSIVLVGEYSGSAALFGMSTVARQPIFLGFIRYGDSVNPYILGTGYGSEVLISEKNTNTAAKQFIYDIGQDQLSQLDTITHTSGSIWSVGTFLNKRFALVEDGQDLTVYSWGIDDVPSTTVDGRMESGAWDMELPEDEKQLDGIHVLSNANATKQVTVYYQDNEDGTWTSAGTAVTGFHNYLAVSDANSTVKFRTLRLRIDTVAGAKVYGVSVRYRVNTYEEAWELLLDLTDEVIDDTRPRRKRDSQNKGWQLRDYIRDIADNKTVVTFLDGAKYPQDAGDDPNKYSTHTVVIDIPVDRIERPGEGTMLARLRSVAVN